MTVPKIFAYGEVSVIVRDAVAPPEEALRRIGREPGRRAVVVAADPPLALAQMAALLADHLPVGCRSVRLVLSNAARPDVARPLSDMLGVEVVAPTGPVLLLPSGLLFVVGGGWQAYRPGEPVVRHDARHPVPAWAAALPERLDDIAGGGRFTAFPAGLWLHGPAVRGPSLTPSVLAVPVSAEQLTVLVGHPSAPAPDPEDVYAALEALPRQARRRLTLIPYGPGSTVTHEVGERLAARTGGTVDVVAGVPDTDHNGQPVHTTVDENGGRGWRPLADRFLYRAGAAPQVTQWAAEGPPWWRVDPAWSVEVVRCGFWLRGHDDEAEADIARRIPVDSGHAMIYLGERPTRDPAALASVLDRVVGQLPADVARGMRLVVSRAPENARAGAWHRITERYGPLLTVVGNRQLVPIPTIEQPATAEYPVVRPTVALPPVALPPVALPDPAPAGPLEQETAEAVVVPSPSPSVAEPVPEPEPEPAETVAVTSPSVAEPEPVEPAVSEALAQSTVETPVLPAAPVPPPPWRGVVFAAWRSADEWRPGAVFTAPDMLDAAVRAPDEAAAELVAVWSVDGRRLPGAGLTRPAVAFPPGTRFRTLDVDTADPRWSRIVLLRELPQPDSTIADSMPDTRVRETLRRAVEASRRAPQPVG
jgi:hypothetical protein